ncbi:response regulator transcription factor [Aquibacillus sediminis]|uniref:response regulator transcription factor n=1 Tax=Aquibacillus sediminis TaxID=2574734 RepID=UPI0011093979|nr:response regulator transcription factor [Aquibacillus sediminis]
MKISVVKEPSLLREGIVRILQESYKNHNITTYGSNNYEELLHEPNVADVIIIDIDTEINVRPLVDYYKNKKKSIILWTANRNHPELPVLFKLRLAGYFYNGMDKEELVGAITSILNGGTYIHQSLSQILLGYYAHKTEPEKPVGVFSEREWEVIELLAKGFKNVQIANFLFISEKTVKNYISGIMKKLAVPDRTNIVLTALKNKWIVL